MIEIKPAIISSSFSEIKARIDFLEGVVPWVHLDIMDGRFVEPTTWQVANDLKEILGQIKIEAHLMINQPEEVLPFWLDNVDRVIIHLESTDHLAEIIDRIKLGHVRLGLALKLETPIEEVLPFAEHLDLIQLMSIKKIGYHGELFDLSVLEKISALRSQLPNVKIQVDGGLNLDTANLVVEAGANILVAGSAIWQSTDPLALIKKFEAI